MEELIRLAKIRGEAEEELKLAIKVTDEDRKIAENIRNVWASQQSHAD